MRKFYTLVATALIAVGLTACSVSAEEKQSCQDRGGAVESPSFEYEGKGFFGRKTGDLHVCEKNGEYIEVYNEEIFDADPGFFQDGDDNYHVWQECSLREGRTYKTTYHAGKSSYTRFACVHGGQYVKILGD